MVQPNMCCGPRAAADSKLWGVAAPGWRSSFAAPLRRISGGLCRGARLFGCTVGPWRLGTSPKACRVQAVAARRCSAVRASRRGTERANCGYRVGHAQRCAQCTCAVPGRGSTASHQTMTASVMYCSHVPAPPSPNQPNLALIPSIPVQHPGP